MKMLCLSVFGLVLASVSAMTSISANTRAGQRLLKNSKLIEGRGLNENQNNIENVIAQMVLRYKGCFNSLQLSEEGGGQDGGSGLQSSGIITFELAESCSGGSYIGKYATNMLDFLDSYTESMLEEQEWRCEAFRENQCAYCENYDDGESCENSCFANGVDSDGNSMAYCIEQQDNGENGEVFEVQRYLECAEMEANNNNNNGGNNNNGNWNNNNGDAPYNWDGQYRIGPYCDDDGKSIYLGVFYDEQCTIKGQTSQYANMNYGETLPYSDESLIPHKSCVKCVDEQKQNENNGNNNNNNNNNNNQNNANNNNWYNMEPREFCVQAYEMSTKCEQPNNGLIYYTSDAGCEFINSYLPNLTPSSFKFATGASGGKASLVFAWVFGITTILFGAYAYFLYRKIKRGGAGLSSQDGGAMA